MALSPHEPAPPLTQVALERCALWHLGRRALTSAELRMALQRKASRHPPHPESPSWVEALVARFTANEVLNDGQVARDRVEVGRSRGWSRRRIEQKLRGVDAEVKREAFATVDADSASGVADAELAAARLFVQKKRLAAKEPQKAMGALARQGFSYAVARAALAQSAGE